MKTPVKILLITLVLAVALPLVVWTGVFLYWHLTIKNELREIEKENPQASSRALFITTSGGCRALPYLIDTLETSRHLMLLDTATEQIPLEVLDSGRPTASEESAEVRELFTKFPFRVDDTAEVRRASYLQILAWWKANRAKYHQWWRVWSSRCAR